MLLDIDKIRKIANHPAVTRPAGRLARMRDLCPLHIVMARLKMQVNGDDPNLVLHFMEAVAGHIVLQAACSVAEGGLPEGTSEEQVPEDFVHKHLDFMLNQMDNLQEMSLAVSAFMERCELLPAVDDSWVRPRLEALDEDKLQAKDLREHGKAIYYSMRRKSCRQEMNGQQRNDAGVALLAICAKHDVGWKDALAEARKLLDADLAALPPA